MASARSLSIPALAEASRRMIPGLALSIAVAIAATLAAPAVAKVFPIPAMVLALVIGIACNGLAARPAFQPGLVFSVKTLLRWAVGLLGLRIALGDIAALGIGTGFMIVAAMTVTILAGFAMARWLDLPAPFGALAGAGTAVCGASATLATATVLPQYGGKEADVAFVVVAVNALSTLAMVAYPPLAIALGFDHHVTGILLGATIHDVAQVVGAGYAVSDVAGNAAVIVKLFRVFLLLPVVLLIGLYFARTAAAEVTTSAAARVPIPVFAFVFLGLCILNSVLPSIPALAAPYALLRGWLIEASTAGLLIAIAALGLGTSIAAIGSLGWRHILTVCVTTVLILAFAVAGLFAII